MYAPNLGGLISAIIAILFACLVFSWLTKEKEPDQVIQAAISICNHDQKLGKFKSLAVHQKEKSVVIHCSGE